MAVQMAACQPDPAAEREHLTALLPAAGPTAWRTTDHAADPRAAAAGCAVLDWARSGLMALTGPPGGVPLAPAAPVLPRTAVVASLISELAGQRGAAVRLDLDRVLASRAAENGWQRHGTSSASGTCRLMRGADGWLAISLSRPDDLASVPALLGRELGGCPWSELTSAAARIPAADLAGQAQLLGIPAAALGTVTAADGPAPVGFSRLGTAGRGSDLVLDLSALWAGPLCASILRQAGWRTLKVEHTGRPDGARAGAQRFYAGLHAGGAAIQLDFASPGGRAELARLAGLAGVIVESSRPRALRRLGLVAEDWLAAAPGRTWISITGYGRADRQQRVAFGDDAAVAGGLVATGPDGAPVFCGDAIADPLTGLFAALAGLASAAAGGGLLADVAMAAVCADLARPGGGPVRRHEIMKSRETWRVSHGDHWQQVAPR